MIGLPRELIAVVLVVIFAWGAGVYWESGRARHAAELIAASQAEKDATASMAYAKAVEQRSAAERAAQDANRRIVDDLTPKLAASRSDAARLAKLLSDALQAHRGPEPAAPDQPGTADPTGIPGSESQARIDTLADAFAACQRDSDRLSALQAEVKSQL